MSFDRSAALSVTGGSAAAGLLPAALAGAVAGRLPQTILTAAVAGFAVLRMLRPAPAAEALGAARCDR
ncbi:hypothetical protein [Streptomyces sp. NPDC055243]|uniref:hypothetical protein n=1 Tax=Streptomyces sp. NPDC055243 TaxID=3365720 RepID=UPI0037CF418C